MNNRAKGGRRRKEERSRQGGVSVDGEAQNLSRKACVDTLLSVCMCCRYVFGDCLSQDYEQSEDIYFFFAHNHLLRLDVCFRLLKGTTLTLLSYFCGHLDTSFVYPLPSHQTPLSR